MKYLSIILLFAASFLPTIAGAGETNALVSQTNLLSGIHGQAVLWPIAPVERPGQPGSKAFPYAAIVVQSADGHSEVARTNADQEGHFEFTLPPGEYVVSSAASDTGKRFPHARPTRVTVPAGSFTNIVVKFDTGIRRRQ